MNQNKPPAATVRHPPAPTDTNPTATKHRPIFWFLAGGGVLLMVAGAWFLDLEWLHAQAQSLNGWIVILLLLLLPLLGVPASILYVVGGAKFGHGWGLVVAAGAISFHLTASWWIARGWLKRPLAALLQRFGSAQPRVPEGEYVPVCLLVAFTPGVSYTFKNYFLALADVPFRPFFWSCLPVHLLTASLAIFFGGFTGSMTKPKVTFLLAYAALLFGVARYTFRRLKARRSLSTPAPESPDRRSTEDDLTRPG